MHWYTFIINYNVQVMLKNVVQPIGSICCLVQLVLLTVLWKRSTSTLSCPLVYVCYPEDQRKSVAAGTGKSVKKGKAAPPTTQERSERTVDEIIASLKHQSKDQGWVRFAMLFINGKKVLFETFFMLVVFWIYIWIIIFHVALRKFSSLYVNLHKCITQELPAIRKFFQGAVSMVLVALIMIWEPL